MKPPLSNKATHSCLKSRTVQYSHTLSNTATHSCKKSRTFVQSYTLWTKATQILARKHTLTTVFPQFGGASESMAIPSIARMLYAVPQGGGGDGCDSPSTANSASGVNSRHGAARGRQVSATLQSCCVLFVICRFGTASLSPAILFGQDCQAAMGLQGDAR